ncbi:Candidapepsin-6 [Candida viswanathii]|uniref:Candidapepsin-6 n=1 Tax=Candida viswanathii TaxID=5486 RepID=A0A367XZC8_9ASCO|nr:Candidapepsin-6 [Candida viswanathii]
MIFKLLLSVFFGAFATAAAAVEKRDARVINMDLHDGASLAKRDGGYGWIQQKAVTLIVDTGSWLIQVYSANASCVYCKNFGVYNASASTTSVRTGKRRSMTYEGGNFYIGEEVRDDIALEGYKISNVTFDSVYNSTGFGYGILGLALPPSWAPRENIVYAAKLDGQIDKAIYSVNLPTEDNPGKLIIGGYNAAKIDGDVHWSNIKADRIHATVNYITINGTQIPVNRNYNLDTGGKIPNVPKAVFDQIMSNLPVEQDGDKYYYDCSYGEGKTIIYNLNGIDYHFPYTGFSKPTGKDNKCEITYRAADDSSQFGAQLFRYLFLAVDVENGLLGLAKAKNTNEIDIRAF